MSYIHIQCNENSFLSKLVLHALLEHTASLGFRQWINDDSKGELGSYLNQLICYINRHRKPWYSSQVNF